MLRASMAENEKRGLILNNKIISRDKRPFQREFLLHCQATKLMENIRLFSTLPRSFTAALLKVA
jgi:hypothetical protein